MTNKPTNRQGDGKAVHRKVTPSKQVKNKIEALTKNTKHQAYCINIPHFIERKAIYVECLFAGKPV